VNFFGNLAIVYGPIFTFGFMVGGFYAAFWSHKEVVQLREELTQPKKTSASA
jgi:hypothetical protein